MVSTTLTPGQLKARTKVDAYDPERGNDPENGYQRRASTSRIAQAAAFYGEGIEKRQGQVFDDRRGLMPNPIIANVRPGEEIVVNGSGAEFPPGISFIYYDDADRERVLYAILTGGNTTANAIIELTDEVTAWIVDGQHRAGAVFLLNDRKRLSDDFPVPLKLMLAFVRPEEMRHFFYINSQAKNVPTDLTAELLQKMAASDPDEAKYLSERKGKASLLVGAAIHKALVKKQSPWIERIRRPNEPASKDTSIALSQFISSLAPLQSAQMARELDPDEWALVLDSFWDAVAHLLPQPFDATEQPGNWVLLKATGANVMHRVLADCLPTVIQRGGRLSDPQQYEQLLVDLPTLSGSWHRLGNRE